MKELSYKEKVGTDGGILLAVAGLALGWMAIGATICWEMAKDNREC
ncbi:hypothetical protein [Zobellia russellii]